jgi:hypothetical protein
MMQFMLPSLGASHLSLAMIHCGNELVSRGHQVRVFVQDKGRPSVRPIFPVFDASYSYLDSSPMVIVGVPPLRSSFVSPAGRKALFYVWDLEWTQRGLFRWSDVRSYYQTYPILARSETHARVLSNTWGCRVAGIVEDFDADAMENAFKCLHTNIS